MPGMHPLETWLEESGTTQDRLAVLAGTQQPRISAFLNGRGHFGAELAERISVATKRKVSLADLLIRIPEKAAKSTRRTHRTRKAARQ